MYTRDGRAELELQMAISSVWPDLAASGGLCSAEPPSDDLVHQELAKEGLRINAESLTNLKDWFKHPSRITEGRELSWDEFQRFMEANTPPWIGNNPMARKMLFDMFDEDDNRRLSYIEVARCLALIQDDNPAERATFLYRRHANGQGGLTVDGLTRLMSRVDHTQPEKHCRVLAEGWFQKMHLSNAQAMNEEDFKKCLNDGLRDTLSDFYSLTMSRGGPYGGGRWNQGPGMMMNQ